MNWQEQALTAMLLSAAVAAWHPARAAELAIEVTLDSFTIRPDRIEVKVGQPVILNVKNMATLLPHDLIIKAPEAGLDVSLNLRAGKSGSVSFTATQPGEVVIYCSKKPPFGKTHRERGMHATLVVTE